MYTKTLWIKDEHLLLILDGRKKVEIRVGYDNIQRLQIGDHLLLNDKHRFTITRIGHYSNFENMLQSENPELIAPDTPRELLLDQIRAIYPPEKEELGVVALEIEPINELRVHIRYEYEPKLLTYLRSMVNPSVKISVGEESGHNDYEVLVAGRPKSSDIEASPFLDTLIIPWAGLPLETRELLSAYPSIAVHNLHHNAAPVAELTLGLLLAAGKGIIQYDKSLRQHDWTLRYDPPTPSKLFDGLTALILGYGEIGRRVAKLCTALNMHVMATRQHPSQSSDDYASEIHPPHALSQLLPRANVLIICLPLTPQTENLIGENELTLLPRESILVNIGRGQIVNEAALFQALQNGQLYAAGLDVWYNYPSDKPARTHTPAANFPFHELENVVMSPHRAGSSSESDRLRMMHLAKLLNAKIEGRPVPNRVDISSGY